MKIKSILSLIIFVTFILICESRRGGGFGRSSGSSGKSWGSSKSSSSSGSGWSLFGGSKPSPSYPSPSYSAPSYPSPSYGWNFGSRPSGSSNSPASKPIGWNVGSPSFPAGPVISSSSSNTRPIGWNVGGTQLNPSGNTNSHKIPTFTSPVGPPPAYPGLSHQPVNKHNLPPAYSPSYMNPPAYSPSYIQRPSSNQYYPTYTYSQYPAGSPVVIHNNYGANRPGFSSNLLTYGMFYGMGRWHGSSSSGYYGNGYGYGSGYGSGYGHRSWSSDEDRDWRRTTKAPYFQNKVPGAEMILPAAAVLGAQIAFGVKTLLPLEVPVGKPLLSCNSTFLQQVDISFNGNIFHCVNGSIILRCKVDNKTSDITTRSVTSTTMQTTSASNADINEASTTKYSETSTENPEVYGSTQKTSDNESAIIDVTTEKIYIASSTELSNISNGLECTENNLACSDVLLITNGQISCENKTLFTTNNMVCNSFIVQNVTYDNQNETRITLQCEEGTLPESLRVYVPTEPPTTTKSPTTSSNVGTFQKFKNTVYDWILWSIGRSDVTETTTTPPTTTTTSSPIFPIYDIHDDITTDSTTEVLSEEKMLPNNSENPITGKSN